MNFLMKEIKIQMYFYWYVLKGEPTRTQPEPSRTHPNPAEPNGGKSSILCIVYLSIV